MSTGYTTSPSVGRGVVRRYVVFVVVVVIVVVVEGTSLRNLHAQRIHVSAESKSEVNFSPRSPHSLPIAGFFSMRKGKTKEETLR